MFTVNAQRDNVVYRYISLAAATLIVATMAGLVGYLKVRSYRAHAAKVNGQCVADPSAYAKTRVGNSLPSSASRGEDRPRLLWRGIPRLSLW